MKRIENIFNDAFQVRSGMEWARGDGVVAYPMLQGATCFVSGSSGVFVKHKRRIKRVFEKKNKFFGDYTPKTEHYESPPDGFIPTGELYSGVMYIPGWVPVAGTEYADMARSALKGLFEVGDFFGRRVESVNDKVFQLMGAGLKHSPYFSRDDCSRIERIRRGRICSDKRFESFLRRYRNPFDIKTSAVMVECFSVKMKPYVVCDFDFLYDFFMNNNIPGIIFSDGENFGKVKSLKFGISWASKEDKAENFESLTRHCEL